MPLKLKYDGKNISADKWLDDDAVIASEELANFRKLLSLEFEMQILRSVLVEMAGDKFPKSYIDALGEMGDAVQARSAESSEYTDKYISLDYDNWKDSDFKKASDFLKYIGIQIPGSVLKMQDLKDHVKALIGKTEAEKYESHDAGL